MAVDYRGIIQERTEAVKETFNALVQMEKDQGLPAFLMYPIASVLSGLVLVGSILYIIVVLGFVSLGTTLVKFCLDTIKSVRQDGAADFAEVTAEALSEFMAIEVDEVDFKTGKDAAASLQRAKQLGNVFVDMLEKQFGEGGVQSPEAGENAAKAMAGYGINFATSNTFLGLMVEMATDGKLEDFEKLGEDVASSVGLGRLTRRALQPLVRNAIAHPYDRKLRAQYRPDIMGFGELVKAYLGPRYESDRAMTFMQQHGFSDDQIAELIAQQTPRLKAEEWELLRSMNAQPVDESLMHDIADGAPPDVVKSRLQVLAWHRLSSARNRVLNAVLSSIRDGFSEPSELDGWLQRFGVPQDEADMWRLAAGFDAERTRKRIDKGEMLFLYEASQVTDEDVQLWAEAEGYGSEDVQRVLGFFRLKAVEASHKTSGGAAAKAAHIHKEHVAYVTDEITGLWGRKPTTAELNYWVTLLDNNERTKHDFLTELKALDTSGPAIPK